MDLQKFHRKAVADFIRNNEDVLELVRFILQEYSEQEKAYLVALGTHYVIKDYFDRLLGEKKV